MTRNKDKVSQVTASKKREKQKKAPRNNTMPTLEKAPVIESCNVHANTDQKSRTVADILTTVLMAACAGLVGTFIHRLGASDNIPYGLLLAFTLLIISSYRSRFLLKIAGLGLHLFVFSMVIWAFSGYGPGADVLLLIPNKTTVDLPWFSQYVSLLWFFGSVAVQLIMLILPAKLFRKNPLCAVA